MRYEEHDLCVKGMDALIAALGIVDAERFVMIMNRDSSDYTEWRANHLYQNETLESLAEKARETGKVERTMRGILKVV